MKLDTLYFETRSEAEMVLDELKDIANEYGNVSLSDYYELAGVASSFEDTRYGWTYRDLYGVKVKMEVYDAQTNKLIYYISLDQPKLINTKNNKEDNTMATTKSCDYTATPEELELEKAIKEAQDEAEKKILDIRMELSKKLEALRTEYHEKETIKREEQYAHAWKRKYDALLKEGFSIEQAWEMTMESFKAD